MGTLNFPFVGTMPGNMGGELPGAPEAGALARTARLFRATSVAAKLASRPRRSMR